MRMRIWLAMLAVYIIWGSTYLAIRFAVETIPPFLMAASRFLVAGSLLFALKRLQGEPAPTKREWRSAAIVGLFLLVGGNGVLSWAEQRVASGIAALLIGAAPLWMALIDALAPVRLLSKSSAQDETSQAGAAGQKTGLLSWIGVLVGFGGIVLLVGPSKLGGGLHAINALGVIALLVAGMSWAIGSLYGRGAPLPASPLLGTGMEMITGGGALLVVGTLAGEWSRLDLAVISSRSLLGLAYLVIFGSWIGFAAYTWLLRVAPTPLVSTYAYVNPLIAIMLGSLLAQEEITSQVLVSALVIISSVALINFSRPAPYRTRAVRVEASSTGDR